MKKTVFLLVFFTLVTACGFEIPAPDQPRISLEDDTLFQASTISAVLAGVYDGNLTIAELKRHGDFGLGTYNALDGEMVVFDGEVYRVRADGAVTIAQDEEFTPFAVITPFSTDETLTISESLSCAEFKERVDGFLPSLNEPYAIQVEGRFDSISARAPRKQSKPYLPLSEALKDQAIFEWQDVRGVMVGFRLPDYLENVNSIGYHFHFLTEDIQSGGHILDCQIANVEVGIDDIEEIRIEIPQTMEFFDYVAAEDLADQTASTTEPIVIGAVHSLTGQ